MPPAAVTIGAAVAPLILNKMFGDDGPTETAGTQQMSAAEIAEANRISQHNQSMQDTYQRRYDAAATPDMDRMRAIYGNEAGRFSEIMPGRYQREELAGLMGLTGTVGGGTVNAQANRQYLDDQAANQAAGGAVNTLVNGLLDFADQRMAKGGEQPVAAQPSPVAPVDGVTVGPQGPVLPGSF